MKVKFISLIKYITMNYQKARQKITFDKIFPFSILTDKKNFPYF